MRHMRPDYASIQPAPGETTIADDEPVFLLRARDVIAPGIVEAWAAAAYHAGADHKIVAAAWATAKEMRSWAAAHGSHVADAPAGALP